MTTLIIGETLVDLISTDNTYYTAYVGGSPLNLACSLASLGEQVAFASSISSDGFSRAIRERLDSAGVSLKALQMVEQPASLALARTSQNGQPLYNFYLQGTSMSAFNWHNLQVSRETRHLHLGSYACCAEPFVEDAKNMLASLSRDITRSLDLNVRLALTPNASRVAKCIEALIQHLDLIKASDEDLELLFPGQPTNQLAQKWLKDGAKMVVITQGSKGSSAFFSDQEMSFAARQIKPVVDTLGCGDTFMAGLLASLYKEDILGQQNLAPITPISLRQALGFASDLAAYNCTQQGASNPTTNELNAWLTTQKK